jgi:hypothetical protein
MSSRFHNKFHRHNHHTTSVGDTRYPDATHDPIASYDSPFQGDFVIEGDIIKRASNNTQYRIFVTDIGVVSAVAI